MTIPNPDVAEDTGMSDDSAVEALLASMTPKPKAADVTPLPDDGREDEPDADEDEDNADADDSDDEDNDEEAPSAEEAEAAKAAEEAAKASAAIPSDEAKVKVTVDGVETEVTVGSLKRLAGQEASLTKKSQEADVVGGRAALMIQGALEGVIEDLEPYRDLDWQIARAEMEPEEYEWHKDNFTRNKLRYDGLVQKAIDFESMAKERADTARAAAALEAGKELVADIPGWNDAAYDDVCAYAVTQGLDKDDVAMIANAKVMKLLRKAKLYDEGVTAAAVKVKAAPVKVKTGAGRESFSEAGTKAHQELEKRVKSGRGSEDDAINLLVGRWKK